MASSALAESSLSCSFYICPAYLRWTCSPCQNDVYNEPQAFQKKKMFLGLPHIIKQSVLGRKMNIVKDKLKANAIMPWTKIPKCWLMFFWSFYSVMVVYVYFSKTRKLHLVTQKIDFNVFKVHLLWALFYWLLNFHYWSRNNSCHFKVKKNRAKGTCFQTSADTTGPTFKWQQCQLSLPSKLLLGQCHLCRSLDHGTVKRSLTMRAWPDNLIRSKMLQEFV